MPELAKVSPYIIWYVFGSHAGRNLNQIVRSEMYKILSFLTKKPRIYTRDPKPPIPPYVMASSATGLNLGVFGFLPTTHAKIHAKQNCVHHLLRTVRRFALICHYAQIAVYTYLTNRGYFDYGKIRRPSNSAPSCLRWHRFWNPWSISVQKTDFLETIFDKVLKPFCKTFL